MYRAMQRDLETQIDDTATRVPANLPKELMEAYMQQAMYEAYDNHLTTQQNDLGSKETAKQYQKELDDEIKRQRKAATDVTINNINAKTVVDTELISQANSKTLPKAVVEAAKAKIAQLEAAENKPEAEKRADNYEGPKAPTPKAAPEGPKVNVPKGEPKRQAGFMEKPPVEPTQPVEEITNAPEERPADLEGLVNPPNDEEKFLQQSAEDELSDDGILFLKKTEEGPESIAHQAVGSQQIDLFTLGNNLNARLNLEPVEIKNKKGEVKTVMRANNAIVELNEEESAALEALFDLRAGDELIFTPEGNYTTQEGIIISSVDLKGLEARLAKSKAANKSEDIITKNQTLVDDAKALLATAAEKGNLVIKVTDISNGAIVNTKELQNLSNLKEHIDRNGLAVVENGLLTSTTGETLVVDGARNGAIYVLIDGPKSKIPVPPTAN